MTNTKLVNKETTAWAECELHRGWGPNLKYIWMSKKPKFLKNISKLWYEKGFFLACQNCLYHLKGYYVIVKMPKTETGSLEDILSSANDVTLIDELLQITPIFSEYIQDIFIIPEKIIKFEKFKNKINLMFRLNYLPILFYTKEAMEKEKNLAHFWNENPSLFWSVKLTKFILSLLEVQLKSKKVNIWLQGNSKIFSILLFEENKLYQINPQKIYRLCR